MKRELQKKEIRKLMTRSSNLFYSEKPNGYSKDDGKMEVSNLLAAVLSGCVKHLDILEKKWSDRDQVKKFITTSTETLDLIEIYIKQTTKRNLKKLNLN